MVHAPVAQHDEPAAVIHRRLDLAADALHGRLQALRAVAQRPRRRDRGEPGFRGLVRAEGGQFVLEKDGRFRRDQPRVLGRLAEQIAPPTHDRVERHDQPLAQRIDGRVRDLREELAEIGVEQAGLKREHGQGRVVAHRAVGLRAVAEHRLEDHVEFLAGVAEGDLLLGQRDDVEFPGGSGMASLGTRLERQRRFSSSHRL